MPTYDYQCRECRVETSVFQTISEYMRNQRIPVCHGNMERRLSVVPAMSGLANALAGDRHYDGLRAPDGTDISSRTKHRQYMKDQGVTVYDDFKGTFKKAEQERNALRQGEFTDRELRQELITQVMTAVAKPD